MSAAAGGTAGAAPGITCPRCGATAAAGSRFCPACGAALPAAGEPADDHHLDHLIARLREATQGEYEVLREIGHGGMAAVYLAWDRGLARYVAIKVLLPELAHHPTMSQRFLQEARTAANLDDHPSVVRVYRAKESQGLRYFVMKYVDGCSLEQLLRSAGPLPPDLAAHVVDQVALALQYAHERGVVHRDVKPGNVLLDRAGHVVVTDFGIAKVAEAEQLTRTGFAIGTPHYMSPEQWRVEPLTPASDQYALGVVAFQLATGAVPFDGTQYAIQEQHLHAAPPAVAAGAAGPSAVLGQVVRRMLAKAPADRYPDLRSVSQALAAIPRDAPAVLRERLSRLIPAANMPGVREVPPAGVAAAHADVAVERRAGEASTTAPARAAAESPAPVAEPTVVAPPAPAPLQPTIRVIAPPARPAPADAPGARGTTTVVRPTPVGGGPAVVAAPAVSDAGRPDADRAVPAATAPEVAPGIGLEDAFADEPAAAGPAARLLEGPISQRYPPPRVGPWLAGAAGVALVVGGGAALRDRLAPAAPPDPAPESARPAAVAAARTAGPAPAAPPAAASPDAIGGPAAGAGDSAAAADSAAEPGVPAALLIVGAPSRGTLSVPPGDSVRLRARVNDGLGTRLVSATVQWASSDPARVAYRNGWAVALAPGGPVAVTATSGPLARSVHLLVTPRAPYGRVPGVTPATASGVARPTAVELRAAVQQFVAALGARDVDEVARRLAPRAVDGSPSRDFVQWLGGAPNLAAGTPAVGEASDEGTRARVAFRVPLRWQGSGPFGDRGRKDVTFWMTLAHDEQGWHGGEVLLGGRVNP